MHRIQFVSVAAALLVSSCVMQAQASGGAHANHAQPHQSSDSLTALLTDPLGSRKASGTATVSGTAVRITWAGDEGGAIRTWSVRRGSCVRDEGLVGAMTAYVPITVSGSGSGASSATLDVPLKSDGQYHVVVHGPGTAAPAASIGCGALRAWMMPPSSDTVLTSSPNGSRPMPVDHSAMDHSAMAMPSDSADVTPTALASTRGMTDSTLMAIHMRMMADPVIRERVMTDPVLQRMMAGMPGMPSIDLEMDTAHATKDSSRTDPPAARAKRGASLKRVTAPEAKPPTKPSPAMPGMDHSKMPMKRKPSA